MVQHLDDSVTLRWCHLAMGISKATHVTLGDLGFRSRTVYNSLNISVAKFFNDPKIDDWFWSSSCIWGPKPTIAIFFNIRNSTFNIMCAKGANANFTKIHSDIQRSSYIFIIHNEHDERHLKWQSNNPNDGHTCDRSTLITKPW